MKDKLVSKYDLRDNKAVSFENGQILEEFNSLNSFLKIHLPNRFHNFLAKPKVEGYFVKFSSDLEGVNHYSKLNGALKEKALIEFSVFLRYLNNWIEIAKLDSSPETKEWINLWQSFLRNDNFEIFASELGACVTWGIEVDEKFVFRASDDFVNKYFEQSSFEDLKHEKNFKAHAHESIVVVPIMELEEVVINNNVINDEQENLIDDPINLPPIVTEIKKESIPKEAPKVIEQRKTDNNRRIRRNRMAMTWLFSLLFIGVLIGLVFWFMKSRHTWDNLYGFIPEKSGQYVQPIENWEPIEDPNTGGKYAKGILNVALLEESPQMTKTKFLEFVTELRPFCEENNIKVNYIDTAVCRMQLFFEEENRGNYKESLKSKFSAYSMLMWEESLFENSKTSNDQLFQDKLFKDYERDVYERIRLRDAWDITMGNPNVVVAVIDNGFDLNHPELSNKSVGGYNVRTGSSDVQPRNGQNHGTHVAGIILANANNNFGMAGVAPDCKLMPIKIGGDGEAFYSSEIIDGILYAANHGATVINMSLGGYFNIPPNSVDRQELNEIANSLRVDEASFWKELFRILDEKKITVVLAAGNETLPVGIDPMSRSNQTIKVMAIDRNNAIASFSNFAFDNRFGFAIAAPGEKIISSVPNYSFEEMDGTSMAAPFVSGAVALIKSKYPEISNQEVIQRLRNSQNYVNVQGFQVPVLNTLQSLQ
jgi:subtilisin family serine protease